MYDVDFISRHKRLGYEVSVDNCKALAAMEKSISRVEGHYLIALPWKSDNLKLPENKFVALRTTSVSTKIQGRCTTSQELPRKNEQRYCCIMESNSTRRRNVISLLLCFCYMLSLFSN